MKGLFLYPEAVRSLHVLAEGFILVCGCPRCRRVASISFFYKGLKLVEIKTYSDTLLICWIAINRVLKGLKKGVETRALKQ